MENRANITQRDEELMREAIRLSRESIAKGGGPFGAVIARCNSTSAPPLLTFNFQLLTFNLKRLSCPAVIRS